jgi:hypothetical protein
VAVGYPQAMRLSLSRHLALVESQLARAVVLVQLFRVHPQPKTASTWEVEQQLLGRYAIAKDTMDPIQILSHAITLTSFFMTKERLPYEAQLLLVTLHAQLAFLALSELTQECN